MLSIQWWLWRGKIGCAFGNGEWYKSGSGEYAQEFTFSTPPPPWRARALPSLLHSLQYIPPKSSAPDASWTPHFLDAHSFSLAQFVTT